MKRAIQWLDKNFEPIIMSAVFYIMTLLIVMQVVLRFGFKSGFSWGEEVARFIFVWLMFFSFSYATRNQRHIRINALVDHIPIIAKRIIYVVVDVMFLVFVLFVAKAAVGVAESIIEYGDMAVTIKVSMNILYGAGLVGFVLMSIRLVQSIVWKLRHFRAPFEIFENYTGVYSGAYDMVLVTESILKEHKIEVFEHDDGRAQ